jgi:transposase-like protein
MSRQYRKFSPEFKDDAVRLVIDGSRPIAQVARELGINEGTLGNWVNVYTPRKRRHWTSASAHDSARPNVNYANCGWKTSS